jgi:hypothetical protein
LPWCHSVCCSWGKHLTFMVLGVYCYLCRHLTLATGVCRCCGADISSWWWWWTAAGADASPHFNGVGVSCYWDLLYIHLEGVGYPLLGQVHHLDVVGYNCCWGQILHLDGVYCSIYCCKCWVRCCWGR